MNSHDPMFTGYPPPPGAVGPFPGWPPPPGGGEAGDDVDVMAYVRLLLTHWKMVVAVALVVTLAGAAWAWTRPKRYRTSAKIVFEASPRLVKSDVSVGLDWWKMERYVLAQIEVLRTERLALRVVERLGLAPTSDPAAEEAAANRLLGAIDVSRIKDTDILIISMTGSDAERISEWLNVYIQEYIAANIDDSLERTRQVYSVIQSKLEPLREQVEQSEERLTKFRERKDSLLFADEDKNVITEQVNTLTTEYAKAKADRIQLETKIAALRQLRAEKIAETSFPEVLNDPTIQSLQQQKNAVEVDLNDKLRTYKEGHPVIKELRSRLNGIDARIAAQIKTILTSLEADYEIKKLREQSLYANIQQLKNQSIDLSKQTMEFEKLRRDYDQNKSFLEEMMSRSKEVDISSSADLNNVRVIDPARPPKAPYTPNLRRSISMSLALGLFLGVGMVFLLDYVDQSLRTPEDVERCTGLDVLAIFPEHEGSTGGSVREAYQSLRTAVMLAAHGQGSHVLMVTSATPQEGKTTVAYSLAETLAMAGSRVLLLDADLRRPRLHRILESGNDHGLTSVVLAESELADVVHRAPSVVGLDVVTSGPLPPNPPELFSNEAFLRLIDGARSGYDWVVVDTPPVMSVTDAVMCSRLVDMVLLVVEYGGVRRQLVRDTVRQLNRAGARVAGAVLNKVNIRRDHAYSYHYSYYHYGYEKQPVSTEKT